MRILITGSSGFIGRALVSKLHQEGHKLTLAMRKQVSNSTQQQQHQAIDVGSIDATTDWTEALQGCDAVIHLAAIAHENAQKAGEQSDIFQRVNCEGTVRLAQSAKSAGVQRFIFLSSVKACCESTSLAGIDETSEPSPDSQYGWSKYRAEQQIREIWNGTEGLLVLRPPLVYGPDVTANFASLISLAKSGLPLPFANLKNKRSFVARDNLIDAIAHALPINKGGTYFVADDHPLSTGELIAMMRRLLTKNKNLFPIPKTFFQAASKLPLLGGKIDKLTQSLVISNKAFKEAFDWAPKLSTEEAIKKTLLK